MSLSPEPVSDVARSPAAGRGRTIVDRLARWSRSAPDRRAFVFLQSDGSERSVLSFGELWQRAASLAEMLAPDIAPGQRAILAFGSQQELIEAFMACQLAGIVAVPAALPRHRQSIDRLAAIARHAEPRAVLTGIANAGELDAALRRRLGRVRILVTSVVEASRLPRAPVAARPDAAAMIQYTSGSTGAPKGVMLSHRALMRNQALIQETFGYDGTTVFAGVVPLFHDMGLIGTVLHPIYLGITCVLIPPEAFLRRPACWLEAISRYGVTTSGGPNYLYDVCVDRVADGDLAGVDLSRWSVAFNGADHVRAATLERFAARFAKIGFRMSAFHPCYGLAEATLLVSGRRPGSQPRIRAVDRNRLHLGHVETPQAESQGRVSELGIEAAARLVSCGLPAVAGSVRIVDCETTRELGCDAVGEVWVRSDALADGYWNDPAATRERFDGRLEGAAGGHLRTGDLGFLDGDGELYITGRCKDLIVLHGQSFYPHDLEEAALQADERLTRAAAFQVDGEPAQLVVLVEPAAAARLEFTRPAAAALLFKAVRRAIYRVHGIAVDAVTMVRTGSLPRTTSGKLRRAAAAAAWHAGELEVIASETRAARAGGSRGGVAALLSAALEIGETELEASLPLVSRGVDSLRAAALANSLEQHGLACPAAVLLAAETLDEIEQACTPLPAATPRAPDGEELPLDAWQQPFWYSQQLRPDSGANNVRLAVLVRGGFDPSLWSQALGAVAARHETLGVTIVNVSGDAPPRQRLGGAAQAGTAILDASDWSDDQVQHRLATSLNAPFDLARGPLIRSEVLRAPHGHVLAIAAHHVAVDLWSLATLLEQAATEYGARRDERPGAPFLAPRLRDFALRNRAALERNRAADLAYWRNALADDPQPLELSLDRPSPRHVDETAARVRFAVDGADLASLRDLCARSGTTLHMALLAVYRVLLYRYTSQCDVLIGTPLARRASADEQLVGCLINPVAIRARADGQSSFVAVLARVRQAMLGALRHGDLPFHEVARLHRQELRTMFALQKIPWMPEAAPLIAGDPDHPVVIGGLEVTGQPLCRFEAPFDLALMIAEGRDRLWGSFDYRTAVLDQATVERLARHFRRLLRAVVERPDEPLACLAMLDDEDRVRLERLQRGGRHLAPSLPVHGLVDEQAVRTPEAVAIRWRQEDVTFRRLRELAHAAAGALRRRGVAAGDRIGLALPPSADWVVATLAAWHAGAVVVPLDPATPPERLRDILEDAAPKAMICDEGSAGPGWSWREMLAEGGELSAGDADPRSPAYITFTSGTAGRPKGVMVTHQGASNFALAQADRLGRAALRRVLQIAPPAFDAAFSDLFMSLTTGGTLCIAGPEARVPGRELSRFIRAERITLITATPSVLATLAPEQLPHVAAVIAMGETCPDDLAARWSGLCRFYNGYGATEASIGTTLGLFQPGRPLGIGEPFANYDVYLLDGDLNRVPPGVPGEIFVGGPGVACGYVGHADWTAEKFLPDPHGPPGARVYRTGDRARWRPDASLEFLGRMDRQVKLRGVRIEPAEIEQALLAYPAVRDCHVEVADEKLVAYVAGPAPSEGRALLDFLRARFPRSMTPSEIVCLDRMPIQANGKLDRRQLLAPLPHPATGDVARLYAELRAAWSEVLGAAIAGLDDNFFDLGGHSLLLHRLQAAVERHTGCEVALLELFEHPTIRALARHLDATVARPAPPTVQGRPLPAGERSIAIIGMAVRFPDAADVESFWHNIVDGRESITFFTPAELATAGVATDRAFVPARGVIAGVEDFDPVFFGFSQREAEILDPQKRLLLELAQLSLDDAAYPVSDEPMGNDVGVFVGTSRDSYFTHNVAPHQDVVRSLGRLKIGIASDPGFAATLIAYKLNLSGPCMSVDTACSTSLVAVHQACQSLLSGECRLALAGGASVDVPLVGGHRYEEGLIASPDGHCRAFDAQAAGTVKGMGGGVVVLKPLPAALADGDHIYAVIRGSAVNNDGGSKIGFTAPSVEGQARVIRQALAAAEIAPEAIGYVEAHGTGTALGDRIEVEALDRALLGAPAGSIALGSVKCNIGHLDAAAGIAGLIKCALVVSRGWIPPLTHARQPSPAINWAAGPLYLPTQPRPWSRTGGLRSAGISSFGIGGTNSHVILEEPPPAPPRDESCGPRLVCLSAGSPTALRAAAQCLAAALRVRGADLADVAFTLSAGRRALRWRTSVVCDSVEGLIEHLAGGSWQPVAATDPPRLTLFFAGESTPVDGAEVARTARDVPAFAAALDDCGVVLDSDSQVQLAGRSLFAVEHALWSWLRAAGVRPAATTGCGIGALVARCAAGTLPLQEGLRLAADQEAEALRQDSAVAQSALVVSVGASPRQALAALGRLWELGLATEPVAAVPPARRIPLPGTSFDRVRVWLDPVLPAAPAPTSRDGEAIVEALWKRFLGVASVAADDDFFARGGDSLLAIELAAELSERLEVKVSPQALFERSRFDVFCEHVALAAKAAPPPPPPAAPAERLPLSSQQLGLWLASRVESAAASLSLSVGLRFDGPVSHHALQSALRALAARHPILLHNFALDGEQVVQWRAHQPEELVLAVEEIADWSAAIARQSDAPLSPAADFLLRAALLRNRAESMLVVTVHHLVADGWSLLLLLRELAALYADPAAQLGPAPSYADYIAARGPGAGTERQRRLASLPTVELPADRLAPASPDERGGFVALTLDAALAQRIRAACRERNQTLFVHLLAAFEVLVRRFIEDDEVVVASPVMHRTTAEQRDMVGPFVALEIFHHQLGLRETFLDVAARVRDDVAAALDAPLAAALPELGPARSESAFRLAFALDHAAPDAISFGPYTMVRPVLPERRRVRHRVMMWIDEVAGELRCSLEYRAAHYDEATIRRYLDAFPRVLEAATRDPATPIGDIEVLSPQDATTIARWNATQGLRPYWSFVQCEIAARAAAQPHAPALSYRGHVVTYATLDAEARRVAQLLLQRRVAPEEPVAVMLDRGIEMVVAALGVLYAGCCYLPIDPELPAARVRRMIEQSGARWVIGRTAPNGATAIDFSEEPAPAAARLPLAVHPRSRAYVLFTSGSTGEPKGVMVEHGALANRLGWMIEWMHFGPDDRVLHKTPAGFDVSLWELFAPLVAGGTVVIAKPGGHRDADYLAALLVREQITIVHFVPSLLQAFLDRTPPAAPHLRWLVCSGEVLPTALYERASAWLGDRRKTVNLYGPTEAAIDVTAWSNDEGRPDVPVTLGRPIPNLRIHILDAHLRQTPIGVTGEMHIGGAGVARGYIGAPALTAERFLPDPFDASGVLYRTGDRARWTGDGEIQYRGRVDQQVKLRGQRIELGEIESVLRRHQSVAEATVGVMSEGEHARLLAHVVPDRECHAAIHAALRMMEPVAEGAALKQALCEQAAAHLPHYMVPDDVVLLGHMPTTHNGKLDRAALPAGDLWTGEAGRRTPPSSPMEQQVAAVWQEILGGPAPGIETNFFKSGGNSLLALRLIAAIEKRMGLAMEVLQLLEQPTLGGLAERLEAAAPASTRPAVEARPAERFAPFPMTELQRAYALGRAAGFQLGNVSTQGYVEIAAQGIEPERVAATLDRLIRRHDMLRAVACGEGQLAVLPEVERYQPACVDLRGASPAAASQWLAAIRSQMSARVFDLEKWPLFEVRLTRMTDDLYRVHIALDAVIVDGASAILLERELNRLYRLEEDTAAGGPAYRDFAMTRAAERSGEAYLRARAYWTRRLAELPEAPSLPLRVALDTIETPSYERARAALGGADWLALQQRGAARGLTAASILIAAYAEVLATWSSDLHFLLNLPIANRPPELSEVVGNFTSTLLLEVDLRAAAGFDERARSIHQRLWSDLAHLAFDGVELQRLRTQRNGFAGARTPIVFTGLLGLPRSEGEKWFDLGRETAGVSRTSQVALDCVAVDGPDGLVFYWDHVGEAFPPGMIPDMLGAFMERLCALAGGDEPWRAGLATAPPAWRAPAIAPVASGISAALLYAPFLEAAERFADRIAVVGADVTLSYAELRVLAGGVAGELRALGVRPGEVVAVHTEKGWEQVVALLGILMAGSAYVPVEASLPPARRRQIIDESGARVAVTQPTLAENVAGAGLATLVVRRDGPRDAGPPTAIVPRDLAYVIFTSGSTGRPKGVAIEHSAAANTILDINRRFHVTETDAVLCVSGLGFDLSVYDIFGLLGAGGRLVFPDADRPFDAEHWWQLIERHQVSLWNTTPLLAEHLLARAAGTQPGPRLFLLSGDWIPLDLPARIGRAVPGAQVVGLGGATECAIWSIFHVVAAVEPDWQSIPYGRPLAGQDVVVLDRALEHCPAWMTGEIYIAGAGLARGYWRQPELTADAFIEHPRWHARLYRTGDLGRYLPDGNIEFLGRRDTQVKIQGMRLELGDVESAIELHAGIDRAVVLADRDGGRDVQRLVAYVSLVADAEHLGGAKRLPAGEAIWEPLLASLPALDESPVDPRTCAALGADLEARYHAAVVDLFAGFPQLAAPGSRVAADELLVQQGIAPRYRRWLERALFHLAEVGILRRLPDGRAEVVQDLGRLRAPSHTPPLAIEKVLREEIHSAQLYADAGTAISYETHYHACHRIAAAVMVKRASVAGERGLRVLEVGAGYGSLTKHVAAVLRPHDTYAFTDVSSFFMTRAATEFACYPFMTFDHYDIDVDPQVQGHARHGYDVVLAASVLHNARSIPRTLAALRSLLAPGGLLLLIEETRFFSFFDLGMGLQQGFDDFDDPLRQVHPLLSRDQWRRALAEAGFARSTVLAAGALEEALGFDVVLAQAPDSALLLDTDELRRHVERHLPRAAVPSTWIQIDAFPCTDSGKIDRRRLTLPPGARASARRGHVAPRTETERALSEIWCRLMGLPQVSVRDDFFAVGGDSLVAARVKVELRQRFGLDIQLRVLFDSGTIEALAAVIEANLLSAVQPVAAPGAIAEAPAGVAIRCSPAQERFLFSAELDGSSNPYRLDAAFRITGVLEVAALQASVRDIVRRHEILRCRFEPRGAGIVIVPTDWEPALATVDFAGTEADLLASIPRLQPEFDLFRGPHLAVALYRITAEHHVLVVSMHHIVTDGGSIGIFARELLSLYAWRSGRAAGPPPEPAHQFRDFAYAQRGLSGEREAQLLADWKDDLEGVPLLALPTDRPRPAIRTATGGAVALMIDGTLLARLQLLKQRARLSDFQVVAAAFWLVLHKHSGQWAIVIGTPWQNRDHPGSEHVIGPVLNLLPLHIRPRRDATLDDLLAEVKQRTLAAMLRGSIPFEQLVAHLGPERSAAYTPIFQAMCAVETTAWDTLRAGDLTIQPLELPNEAARYDVSVVLQQGPGLLRGALKYDRALFDEATAAQMAGHFLAALNSILDAPQTPIVAASLMTGEERRRVIEDWNQTERPYPLSKTLVDLFRDRVVVSPDSIAVEGQDRSLTYRQLEDWSERLADHLAAVGVLADDVVGITLERSLEQVVAMLAVLKAGAACLAVDAHHPLQRRVWMLENAGVRAVIGPGPASVPRVEVGAAAGTPPRRLRGPLPDSACYVIYTSGSTGLPKGVIVDHRAIANNLLWMNDEWPLGADDAVLFKSSPGFDVSVKEIFWPLIAGARLVIAPPGAAGDPEQVSRIIEERCVTVIHMVPTMLDFFLQHEPASALAHLRIVMCGGEALTPALRARFHAASDALLLHMYGPTEAAIAVTGYAIDAGHADVQRLPLGRPMPNCRIYVVDAALQPVSIGVPGQLCIAGMPLARGYLRRPELTAEGFVPDPFATVPGARMYLTGDRARWRPDGKLEYLGRMDRQVKLGGFRIEPAEIEVVLREQAGVDNAVVIVRQDGGQAVLLAYVASRSPEVSAEPLQSALRARLPAFMVPAHIVVLPAMPTSLNGKIDVAALAPPEAAPLKRPAQPPRGELENQVARIWCRVLTLEAVDRNDNFFDLGGHSLLILRLQAQLRDQLGWAVPVVELFNQPTVASLAAYLAQAKTERRSRWLTKTFERGRRSAS